MKTLARLRAQIEKIDARIVGLLNDRLALAVRIGRVKRRSGCSSFFPDREERLLQSLQRKNRGQLPAPHLRAIYREIFSSSRAKQGSLAVGTLACPREAVSLLAAKLRFGAGESYLPHRTVGALVKAARAGAVDVALLPAGDLLRALATARGEKILGPLRARGEITLGSERIYLLGKETPPGDENPLPASKRLWLLRAADTAAALRWGRSCGGTAVARIPGALLLETAGAADARTLSFSLRQTLGLAARLRLLGTFAAPAHG